MCEPIGASNRPYVVSSIAPFLPEVSVALSMLAAIVGGADERAISKQDDGVSPEISPGVVLLPK
jgi:hypothetical protein